MAGRYGQTKYTPNKLPSSYHSGCNAPNSQEQDARSASRFVACFPVGQVPPALKQLSRQLKRDEGFASPGGQSQQNAILASGDGFQNTVDGNVLIVAALKVSTSIFKRHCCESITPGVLFGKSPVPEFYRSRKARKFAFRPVPSCMSMPYNRLRSGRERFPISAPCCPLSIVLCQLPRERLVQQ